ncbi:hypothetical protein PPS11_34958, partial [Pseudomonas putida S11]
ADIRRNSAMPMMHHTRLVKREASLANGRDTCRLKSLLHKIRIEQRPPAPRGHVAAMPFRE